MCVCVCVGRLSDNGLEQYRIKLTIKLQINEYCVMDVGQNFKIYLLRRDKKLS